MFDHEILFGTEIEFVKLSYWIEAILLGMNITYEKVVSVKVPNNAYHAYFDSLLSKWVLKKGDAPNCAPKMPPNMNSVMFY